MPKLTAKIKSYGTYFQVSIPSDLVEKMGWRRGDHLEWVEIDDGLKLFLLRKGKRINEAG